MIYNPVTQDQKEININELPTMRAVRFENDGSKLLGSLFLTGNKKPTPTVILAHGFPGNEHNQDLAHAIRRFGFNVFIFHYRGTWGSEGKFSFNNALDDMAAAYKFIASDEISSEYNIASDKIVVIGHSMGGFATLLNAVNFDSVKNLGFIAGFNFGLIPEFIKMPFARETVLEHLKAGSDMVNGTDEQILLKEIIENENKFNILNHTKELLEKNVLMVGAEYDTTSMIDLHHKPILKALNGNGNVKEIIIQSGHVFSTKRIELAHVVIDWLRNIKF